MTALSDPLDDLITESLTRASEDAATKAARRKLARDPEASNKAELQALITHYDETRVWNMVGNIALIHRYICTCGHIDSIFAGWMREQQHRVIINTRRLVAGKADGQWPERLEFHNFQVHECSRCIGLRFGGVHDIPN